MHQRPCPRAVEHRCSAHPLKDLVGESCFLEATGRARVKSGTMSQQRMLPEPSWETLTCEQEESQWEEDRARKSGLALEEIVDLLRVFDELVKRGSHYTATVDAAREVAGAIEYYTALAGYSSKSLKTVQSIAAARGVPLPKPRSNGDLSVWVAWINKKIQGVLPAPPADIRTLLGMVATVVGGRVIGKSQNSGGLLPIAMLKNAILKLAPSSEWKPCIEASADPVDDLMGSDKWQHKTSGACIDFGLGGNRPDLIIRDAAGHVRLVAEIKGRKDLSNAWESWMPQFVDHLKTWRSEFPGALRGAFMTLVSKEMVTGASASGTRRTGLRELWEAHDLDFLVNLTTYGNSTSDGDNLRTLLRCSGVDLPLQGSSASAP